MRAFLKILSWGFFTLAGLAVLIYAGDDLYARYRGIPVESMNVDRFYAARNRWNQVEYSLGTPVTETCVLALLPHFGYAPCWYLRRHTLRQVGHP